MIDTVQIHYGLLFVNVLVFLHLPLFLTTSLSVSVWLSIPILWKCLSCYFVVFFFSSLENAIVGKNLIGAFIKEIKDGVFLLHLDSKQFLADSVIDFPRDEEFDLSPRVKLGCKNGFRRISSPEKAGPNSQGCGMSYFSFPFLDVVRNQYKAEVRKSSLNLCLKFIFERCEAPM